MILAVTIIYGTLSACVIGFGIWILIDEIAKRRGR